VPADNEVSMEAEDIVGIHYLAVTGEDTEDIEDLVCCSEKSSARICESARITCSHEL
jgi:hypothetical protein